MEKAPRHITSYDTIANKYESESVAVPFLWLDLSIGGVALEVPGLVHLIWLVEPVFCDAILEVVRLESEWRHAVDDY